MAELGLFLRNGGFLLFALFVWLVFTRQRDVLETAETASRIVAGTFLVLSQLACYTAIALIVFVPPLRSTPWNDSQWAAFILAVTYLMPLLVSLGFFVIAPKVLGRQWQLRSVRADHPVHKTIAELSEKLGLSRTVKITWATAGIQPPCVFQMPLRPAMLVLPEQWKLWATQYAQEKPAKIAVWRFALLHELSHVRNGDSVFMTWALLFLQGYRLWAPVVILVQLVVMFIGLDNWLITTVPMFSITATVIIYPLFLCLYLSVSRERELLADARAQLYLGREQLSSLWQKSTLFRKSQGNGEKSCLSWFRRLGRILVETVRVLVGGRAPLAVLPLVGRTSPEPPSFLVTHPLPQVRYRALQERKVIQSRVGVVSTTAARWVGIVTGVFLFFVLLPFLFVILGFVDDSARTDMLMWGGILTLLYPTLALCLPLRNALAYTQPLAVRIRQLLWRFVQAGLCFVGVLLLGYANAALVFSPGGLARQIFEMHTDAVSIGVILSPFLSLAILAFMHFFFRVLDRQSALAILWLGAMTIILLGAASFLILRIQSSDWTPSYTMFAFVVTSVAMAAGLLTIGRLITDDVDFQHRTVTIYWNGRFARAWRREYSTPFSHLVGATLITLGLLGLVVGIPTWGAKLGLDMLYQTVSAGLENLWVQLLLFAGLLAVALIGVARTDRLTTALTEGINKRQVILQDTGKLVEVGSALDIGHKKAPGAVKRCLPAELLAKPTDAPSMPWWLLAMPLETIDWASRLATWRFGSGALSSAVVEHVKRCACAGGGFGLWPGASPRLSSTYHALNILNLAEALGQIESDLHADWILICTDAGGGFRSPEQGKPSLQDSAYALQSLALLHRHDLVDRIKCAKWLEQAWLLGERGLDQTRWAVVCLSALDALSPDFAALLANSWLPRYWSLVVSLRVDKQIDQVWNYVQIVSHLFAPSSEHFDVWIDGLAENVSEGWGPFLDSC